jgi:cell division septal protein FtsQ
VDGDVTAVRRRVTPRSLAVVAAVVLALVAGWLWFRSSSLVGIRAVTIVGVSGPHTAQIDASLRRAAESMTTLDFNIGTLTAAVKRFPEVHGVTASTGFPHSLAVRVDEQLPIAKVIVDGSPVLVASDGALLRGRPAPHRPLPLILVSVPPVGSTLSEPGAPAVVSVLAAAPWALLAHIRRARYTTAHGVVVSLRGGPNIYFGDRHALRAKWLAAAAVLSSSGSAGAVYIDVTDPERPAAGVQTTPVATSTTPTSSVTSPSGSVTTPSGSATSPTGSVTTVPPSATTPGGTTAPAG